jgi:valacyclovir hydrolase
MLITERYADLTTGARLHYEEAGEGAPLIAVHGFMGTARKDLGTVIDWLSADYRVLGLTLRGYGRSTPRPRQFPVDFYRRDAADVLAFMDALEIEQAHLLGYSDGGEIALIVAGTQPDRFLSVAVWGAIGYFGPAVRAAVQAMYPARWVTEEDMDMHGIEDADRFVLAWVQAMKHMVDSGGDVSLSLADRITSPLLMMIGESDKLCPEADGRRFIDRTPNGQLEMFACGHAIHQQQPDRFRQMVGGFLRSVSSGH